MRTYKVEIKLNKEQEALYKLNISACRFIYNLYIQENERAYKEGNKFLSAYTFHKWFNNEYITNNSDMGWLKKASSKALKQSILNCEKAYKKFFEGLAGKPKFKKVDTYKAGFYFVKNGSNQIIKHERNKIKVPCIGWVTLKEMNYLPVEPIIKNGCISRKANKYFISVLTDEEPITYSNSTNEGIGIDLGIKEFMTCSNGMTFDNINKTDKIKKLEKKLKREQRALSRKYEAHRRNKQFTYKNYNKNVTRIQKVNYRLECIRNDYVNKCTEILVEQNPKFITLEYLNIKGMLKNRHLSKAIRDSKLYYTKQRLIQKAQKNGIEVREVGRFYPSSKTCSHCGKIKKGLQLKDRTYKCSCGLEIDRDFNASLNLKNAKEYKILTTGGLPGSNDYGLYKNLGVASTNSMNKTIQNEVVKSQFVLKSYLDKKRNILYNKYVNIL